MKTVSAEILKILKEKDKGIVSGTKAIKKMLEELQLQVFAEISMAAVGSWDAYYLPTLQQTIEAQIKNFTAKAKVEASGMMEDAWVYGQALVDEPLAVAGIFFGMPDLSTSVLDTLKDFTLGKLSNVGDAAFDKIKGELTMGLLGGKTPQEVITAIGKNLSDPSIFKSIASRAEAITKTEMGRVFSVATQRRMKQAAEYVPGLQKQWKHAGHPKKARPTHLTADGQKVLVNERFNIGGEMMEHPRDPGAPLDEVINCG